MSEHAETVFQAPAKLGLKTREEFRRGCESLLDSLPRGRGRLVIDMELTQDIDSAGLQSLMLVQRYAAERKHVVELRNTNEEIRFLLVLTQLDSLFELD